jgi:hypothetical protein
MTRVKSFPAVVAVFGSSMIVSLLGGAKAAQPLEDFKPENFNRSTVIDNEWYPIKPGMEYVLNGYAVDEEGDEEPHSDVFTVTDLVKEIAGVRTVVCWDKDYVDGELEEAEIMFLAQDKDGAVWLLGEYPEEYDNKQFVKQACWIHGLKDARAGILIKKDPKLGMTWAEGWAPSVKYTDRAMVYQVGQKVKTPARNFDNVVVVDESNNEVVGAHHLKFYARGTGVVHVGWRGKKTDQEVMDLYKVDQMSADELAKAREAALKLEKHAYETSKDVYGKTHPSERNPLIHPQETKPHIERNSGAG